MEHNLPPVRVLIADDDRVMRMKLHRFLEQEMGAEVLVAENGTQAWELFNTNDVRLVISDWLMPGCDGPELCRRIREQSGRGYTFFILLTGKTEQEDLLAGMASGADDYVRKPFDPAELQSRVRAGIRVINLERSLAAKNAELSQVNYRMQEAIREAGEVQERLLPRLEFLAKVKEQTGLEVHYRYLSCESLGGDVLGVYQPSPEQIAMFIADVSGHGIAAALSAVGLHTYTYTSLQSAVDPLEVMRRANTYCFQELPDHVYASMAYALIDTRKREAQLLVAGHPPIILTGSGCEPDKVESAIPPLGLFDDEPMQDDVVTLKLDRSLRLVAYTDGVIESRNAMGEFYSYDHLADVVAKASTASVKLLPDMILEELRRWRGIGLPAEDDITIAAMQFND